MIYMYVLAALCQKILKCSKGNSLNNIRILQQAQKNKVQINRDNLAPELWI